MQTFTSQYLYTPENFISDWSPFTAEEMSSEKTYFRFRYAGKLRVGRLVSSTEQIATFRMMEDGNQTYTWDDTNVYKSFTMYKMSHIEWVYMVEESPLYI